MVQNLRRMFYRKTPQNGGFEPLTKKVGEAGVKVVVFMKWASSPVEMITRQIFSPVSQQMLKSTEEDKY